METNNTTPKWRALIERQKAENGMIPSILAAQEYTTLAVNEFANVVEALEETLQEYEYACKNMAALNGMVWSENSVSIKAKEILKRIS